MLMGEGRKEEEGEEKLSAHFLYGRFEIVVGTELFGGEGKVGDRRGVVLA